MHVGISLRLTPVLANGEAGRSVYLQTVWTVKSWVGGEGRGWVHMPTLHDVIVNIWPGEGRVMHSNCTGIGWDGIIFRMGIISSYGF